MTSNDSDNMGVVNSEMFYLSKDVAETLDIKLSTLRRWCLELEKNGYHFQRDSNNNRMFFERDIIVLRQFKQLMDAKLSWEAATQAVIAEYGSGYNGDLTTNVLTDTLAPVESDNERYAEMRDNLQRLMDHVSRQDAYIERQETFNEALSNKLDAQQRIIEESIQKRDEVLMQHLCQLQQTAVSQEKKGVLWRLFGRS